MEKPGQLTGVFLRWEDDPWLWGTLMTLLTSFSNHPTQMKTLRFGYTLALCFFLLGILPESVKSQSVEQGLAALDQGQYESALRIFDMHAHAGGPMAQSRLGYMYHRVLGVSTDREQAQSWYQKAAEQEEPRALNNLGVLLDWEDPEDCRKAYKHLREAAEQGFPSAKTNLGIFLEQGSCFEQPAYGLALIFYRDAAKAGEMTAQHRIGSMYYRGKGVPADTVTTSTWWRLAAKQGHIPSQRYLSYLLAQGEGVKADAWESYMWMHAAMLDNKAIRTSEEWKEHYHALTKQLSTREREAAHREARALRNRWLHSSDRHAPRARGR